MNSNADPVFQPLDPDYEQKVRLGFDRQGLMTTLGASLVSIKPGKVLIKAPISEAFSQQDGYPHAGLGWSIGDSAAGFSALSLMSPDESVLTIEMKTNLLSPAVGRTLIARGQVVRFGRTICTVTADIYAVPDDGKPGKHVATMLGSMIRLAT